MRADRGLSSFWSRIAGFETNGSVFAFVWLAVDGDTDTVHVYDACKWEKEVMVVMAEGVAARGRNIPIAWPKRGREVADQFRERGLFMLPDPVSDDDSAREVATREVLERIRTQRLKAEKRLGGWIKEYQSYRVGSDGVPPRDTHPLMTATNHAIMALPYARLPAGAGRDKARYPRIPIL